MYKWEGERRVSMYTVGEFSKICQVSVKTLHYYDRIGLLAPFSVDRFTGYRYYTRDQVERMLLIGRLKRYGFTLEEIKEFIRCADMSLLFSRLRQQKKILKRQRQEMDLVIKELSDHLQSFERTGNIMEYQKNYEIRLVEAPERAVLANRKMMGVADFGKYYSPLFERIAKDHITSDGMVGAVYHDEEFNHECSDIELIVGVAEKDKADKIMESHLCAVTLHKGAYSSLSDAYGALTAWIEENGYEWDGAPYDIYTKSHLQGLAPEMWETEVYFPVKEKSKN